MIKNKLNNILKEKGVSKYLLSQKTGIPYSTLYKLVNKKDLSRVEFKTLLTITKTLGLKNVMELVDED